MVKTLGRNSLRKGLSISQRGKPFRKTSNSVIDGDLVAPYETVRDILEYGGMTHGAAYFPGHKGIWVCCARGRNSPAYSTEPGIPMWHGDTATCLQCALCNGCPACKAGYLTSETMKLGKWETKDGRKLYPFEMDNTHVHNAIAKLYRDEEHFKDNYLDWIEVLELELVQRGLLDA